MLNPDKLSLKTLLFCLAGLSLVVYFVFSPSLNCGFVNWDDDVHLTHNPFVRSLDKEGLINIFSTTVNHLYIPLSTLSFALEYQTWGMDPFVYHLHNVIFHLCVSGFVFLLGLSLGLKNRAALIGALIFGLHPMHVESVTWVTERKDVLYAFFYLLALLSYQRYLQCLRPDSKEQSFSKRIKFLVLTFFLGWVSLLAKPMALSLPLVLLLMDWFLKRKLSFASFFEKGCLAVLFFPVVWMSYQYHQRIPELVFPDSFLLWIWCFVFYIRKFFYIDYFVLFYKMPRPISVTNPAYLFSLLFFMCICLMVVWAIRKRKYRLFLFAVVYYVFSIFFLLKWDYLKDSNIVADRFMYLPSMGICLWLGNTALVQYHKIKSRRWQMKFGIFVLAVLTLLAARTFTQIHVWKNGLNLWSNQLYHQPEAVTALALNKFSETVMNDASFFKKLEIYKQFRKKTEIWAIENKEDEKRMLDVDFVESVRSNLLTAIEIKPDYSNAQFNLGKLYFYLDDMVMAEYHLMRTYEIDREFFDAYFYLGQVYFYMNKKEQSDWAFEKAVAVSPNKTEMLEHINSFKRKTQQFAEQKAVVSDVNEGK